MCPVDVGKVVKWKVMQKVARWSLWKLALCKSTWKAAMEAEIVYAEKVKHFKILDKKASLTEY